MDPVVDDLFDEMDGEFDPSTLVDAATDTDAPMLVAALAIASDRVSEHHRTELVESLSVDDRRSKRVHSAVAAWAGTAELDANIDDRIADPNSRVSTLEGLLCAGVAWFHPAMVDLLDDDDTRLAAAMLLASSAPGDLEAALDGQAPDHSIELMRAASLTGGEDWFDVFRDWRQQMSDDWSDDELAGLDAAAATVAFDRYAERLLIAEFDDDWLGDDRAVADFLTRNGLNTWLSTLAAFRHVRDVGGFELAATFAVCASTTAAFDDVDTDRLSPRRADDWLESEPFRTAFALAVSDDEQLTQLLVESTLHQAMLERGDTPPPITGLPLSGAPPATDELQDLLTPLAALGADEARDRTRVVRTLTDLLAMVRRGDCERSDAAPWFEALADHSDAAALVNTWFQNQCPSSTHTDWGCRGLHAASWQLLRPPTQALPPLAEGWFCAPVERIQVWRTAFRTALQRRTSVTEDRTSLPADD